MAVATGAVVGAALTESVVVIPTVVSSALMATDGTGVDVGIANGVGWVPSGADEDDESPLSNSKNHKASTTATNNNARSTPSMVRLA